MNKQRGDEGKKIERMDTHKMSVEHEISKLMNEDEELVFDQPYSFAMTVAKKAYNLALEHASEQAFVRWVSNPKMSSPDHETPIIDKQSILDLKV
jgi:hypothetical protein